MYSVLTLCFAAMHISGKVTVSVT